MSLLLFEVKVVSNVPGLLVEMREEVVDTESVMSKIASNEGWKTPENSCKQETEVKLVKSPAWLAASWRKRMSERESSPSLVSGLIVKGAWSRNDCVTDNTS